MRRVIVRYKLKSDCIAENVDYVQKVYAELQSTSPAGLRYATFKATDSPTFFHIASVETENGENPLNQIEAFKTFSADIRDQCEEPPVATAMEEIGSYNFFG